MSAHRAPVLLDSIALVSTLGEHSANTVIVSGSHGGVSAASFVVDHPHRPMIVFFNDAGIGKDSAGIAGLAMLEAIGVAGCAYSHVSARIGEAADGLANGVVSHVNAPARAMGIQAGDRVAALVAARCGPAAAVAPAPVTGAAQPPGADGA
jgi:hypothetical protein